MLNITENKPLRDTTTHPENILDSKNNVTLNIDIYNSLNLTTNNNVGTTAYIIFTS